MLKKRVVMIFLISVLGTGGLWMGRWMHQQKVVSDLMNAPPPPIIDGPGLSLEESEKLRARRLAFNALWLARMERDVSQEIVPYLQDPDVSLRTSAVRALGMLENPGTETALVECADREKNRKFRSEAVDPLVIDFALTRVGTSR